MRDVRVKLDDTGHVVVEWGKPRLLILRARACPSPVWVWASALHDIPGDNFVEYEVGDGWVRASVDAEGRDLEVTLVEEAGQTRRYFSTYAHGQHYAGIVGHVDGVTALAEFFQTGVLDDRHLDVGKLGAGR